MVTQYKIEVGYNSAKKPDEVWLTLKQVVFDIQDEPNLIISEVLRCEPNWHRSESKLKEFAVCYCRPVEDLTIKVIDDPDQRYISQMASGGGIDRELKEACRRAFCRLVLERMHRHKMEIDIVVC